MKQKIVMKVLMPCQKCRSKAMEIAAAAEGVISVGIEGKDQDQLVVIGDGVDSTCLVKRLRKKIGYTVIISVEEVKKPEPKPEPEPETPCQQNCHLQCVCIQIVDDPCPSTCPMM